MYISTQIYNVSTFDRMEILNNVLKNKIEKKGES